jgi:hypothetical protein
MTLPVAPLVVRIGLIYKAPVCSNDGISIPVAFKNILLIPVMLELFPMAMELAP